jgi:hypothetical protein
MLLGLLTMIRELFGEKLFETPFITDWGATREHTEHSSLRSSSTIRISDG